jgi:large subunit ribosomal protein L24
MMIKTHVKKGDQVIVISGKDKGKIGQILSVNRKDMRVVVQGVGVKTKHQKATMADTGGLKKIESSIHISNVMHLDPKDNKPTRIGRKILKDGARIRFAKRSGEAIDK